MGKNWLENIQPLAKLVVWIFGMLLGSLTVWQLFPVLSDKSQWSLTAFLVIAWILSLLVWCYEGLKLKSRRGKK